jgi:hypothetical protein
MSGITSGFEGKAEKLRVKEGFKEDAGRGIARIDPNIIQELEPCYILEEERIKEAE